MAGALRLPLGAGRRQPSQRGTCYVGVRGKQGYKKDMIQGTTPKKKRCKKEQAVATPGEAAVALAELR